MISEGNSALLPVNVDRRLPLQQRLMNFQLQNFHFGSASGNYEILGKQNELFPLGPVIKCLLFALLVHLHVHV